MKLAKSMKKPKQFNVEKVSTLVNIRLMYSVIIHQTQADFVRLNKVVRFPKVTMTQKLQVQK